MFGGEGGAEFDLPLVLPGGERWAIEIERALHPGAVIETFATDGHRIGLKPIIRRVRAPRGERPVAPCHHRFEWLYVAAFVSPAAGGSFRYLASGVGKARFEHRRSAARLARRRRAHTYR